MNKSLSIGMGVNSIQLADLTRFNPLCEELHQLKVVLVQIIDQIHQVLHEAYLPSREFIVANLKQCLIEVVISTADEVGFWWCKCMGV